MSRGTESDFQIYAVQYTFAAASRELPTDKEFLLDALVNGAIAHAGGAARKIRYANSMLTPFTDNLWDEFRREAKREKFQAEVYACIESLVKPVLVRGYHNDHGTGTPFYQLVAPGMDILGESFESVRYLSSERMKSFLSKGAFFSAKERENLESIAHKMTPFIKEDLKHIRANCFR